MYLYFIILLIYLSSVICVIVADYSKLTEDYTSFHCNSTMQCRTPQHILGSLAGGETRRRVAVHGAGQSGRDVLHISCIQPQSNFLCGKGLLFTCDRKIMQ